MSKTLGKVTASDMTDTLDYEMKIPVVNGLNTLLADEYGLFTKTLNYHWNITGPRFHSLHEFLEGHYRELLDVMDAVAERVRFLGETPLSTVSALKAEMKIPETDGEKLTDIEMLEDLLRANISLQSKIKQLIKTPELSKRDPGTEDFLVGVLRQHEKMSWMLRSHLQ